MHNRWLFTMIQSLQLFALQYRVVRERNGFQICLFKATKCPRDRIGA